MPFSTLSPLSMGNMNPPVTYIATGGPDLNSTVKQTLTQTLPFGVQTGYLMVAFCAIDTSAAGSGWTAITPPSGWVFWSGHPTDSTTPKAESIYIYYRYCDSSDVSGATYTWTLGGTKAVNDSSITTMVFANAMMPTLTSAPVNGVSDGAGNITHTFPYTRTAYNSMFIPFVLDGANGVTAGGATTTSGDQYAVWSGGNGAYGPGGITPGIGSTTFAPYNSGTSSWRYADTRASDTIQTYITTTTSASNCQGIMVEILPNVMAEPTLPFIRWDGVTEQSVAASTNVSYDVSGVGFTVTPVAGDTILVFCSLNRVINSWSAPGFTTIFSRTTNPPIYIGYKTAVGGDLGPGLSFNANANNTVTGHTYSILMSPAVYDTAGTAATGTSGASVSPAVTATSSYSTVLSFAVSSNAGNWSCTSMTEELEDQVTAPGMSYFSQGVAAGTFTPTLVPGTGGLGSTFGISVSFTHV
jgi:hypothetical protein